MKSTLKNLAMAVLLVALAATGLHAQANAITKTTTSSATTVNAQNVVVASATGFLANDILIIDHEAMQVASTYTSGTTIPISQRGYSGTLQTAHASGQVVLRALAANVRFTDLWGSCTAANQNVLPVPSINRTYRDVLLYNCNNGVWVQQTLPNDIPSATTRYCAPNFLGALALLSTFGDANAPFVVGNNQTPVAGTIYYGTIDMPQTRILTGISVLNGTVASTDNLLFGLYRADGVLVANTAVAGTTASGIGRFQDIAFTSTYLATGPARYWIAVQADGATTRFRDINLTPGASTAGLGAFIGMLGSSVVGTFGTLPSLTATAAGSSPATTVLPTTLIANTAPIGCVY